MSDSPLMIKDIETIKASTAWFSCIWLKIKSMPIKVGVIGNAASPKQASKKAKDKCG